MLELRGREKEGEKSSEVGHPSLPLTNGTDGSAIALI